MRIASPTAHRTLAYIAAVSDQGYTVSVSQANAYHKASLEASMPRGLSGLVYPFGDPSEKAPGNLQDLGWVRIDDNKVSITPLGRALLKSLNQEEIDPEEEPFDIVLDADNPLAYAQVIGRIAKHENALLVDPYFKLDQLLHIIQDTQVTRLLTGDKNADRPGLRTALRSPLPEGRTFEIRVSGEVHDRYVIPRAGSLDMIGTSLSGVGRRPSAMVRIGPPSADLIRDLHERLWQQAEPLKPAEEKSPPALKQSRSPRKKAAARRKTAPRRRNT